MSESSDDILRELAQILEARKAESPDDSYVAGLYAGGNAKIAKKLGEESAEAIIAGISGSDQELVHEIADLWFHAMVLLAHRGLSPDDVIAELGRRFGTSGLVEKAARKDNAR